METQGVNKMGGTGAVACNSHDLVGMELHEQYHYGECSFEDPEIGLVAESRGDFVAWTGADLSGSRWRTLGLLPTDSSFVAQPTAFEAHQIAPTHQLLAIRALQLDEMPRIPKATRTSVVAPAISYLKDLNLLNDFRVFAAQEGGPYKVAGRQILELDANQLAITVSAPGGFATIVLRRAQDQLILESPLKHIITHAIWPA